MLKVSKILIIIIVVAVNWMSVVSVVWSRGREEQQRVRERSSRRHHPGRVQRVYDQGRCHRLWPGLSEAKTQALYQSRWSVQRRWPLLLHQGTKDVSCFSDLVVWLCDLGQWRCSVLSLVNVCAVDFQKKKLIPFMPQMQKNVSIFQFLSYFLIFLNFFYR